MKHAWWLAVVMAVLAATGAGARKPPIKFYGSAAERKQVDALHGKPAPELERLTWVQGGPLKLSGLRGKVVLLDIWAQW